MGHGIPCRHLTRVKLCRAHQCRVARQLRQPESLAFGIGARDDLERGS